MFIHFFFFIFTARNILQFCAVKIFAQPKKFCFDAPHFLNFFFFYVPGITFVKSFILFKSRTCFLRETKSMLYTFIVFFHYLKKLGKKIRRPNIKVFYFM